MPVVVRPPSRRQREPEAGASTETRFDPDPPASTLQDPLARGESDPAARVAVARVQALEDLEDALALGLVDSDPVVADEESPRAGDLDGSDLEDRKSTR